jgi:hypothetical protein
LLSAIVRYFLGNSVLLLIFDGETLAFSYSSTLASSFSELGLSAGSSGRTTSIPKSIGEDGLSKKIST